MDVSTSLQSSTKASRLKRLALWFIPAAIVTWGIHEFAHWATGELLGYDMWLSFNQAGLIQGEYGSTTHQILVDLAGPAMTWAQAILALYFIRRFKQGWIYAFLFLAFWMRGLAMAFSFISLPNDEARASLLLDLPMSVLPALSVIVLLVFTYIGSKTLNIGWKGNIVSIVMASLVTAMIVYADQLIF